MRFFCATAVALCKTETVLRPSPCGSAVAAPCEDPPAQPPKNGPATLSLGSNRAIANGNPGSTLADGIEPGRPCAGPGSDCGATHASAGQHPGVTHPRTLQATGGRAHPTFTPGCCGWAVLKGLRAFGAREPGASLQSCRVLAALGAELSDGWPWVSCPLSRTRSDATLFPSPPTTARGQEG